MADVIVAPGNSKAQAGSVQRTALASEAIQAGKSVYLDASGQVTMAEKDQTIVEATAVGISLNPAAVGQPCRYIYRGSIVLGVSPIMTVGRAYIVGAAPGGIAPEADAISSEFVAVIGVAITDRILKLGPFRTPISHT